MKYLLTALLFSAAFCSAAPAPECSKNSDACSAVKTPKSPFEAASANPESAPAPAVKEPAKKKAASGPAPAPAPAPAQAPAVSTPAAAAQPVKPAIFSSPLWLLFVFAGLAGLYGYLRSGKKSGRK